MTETKIHPFIARLQELANRQERGALAALRRGLGQPPGTTPEMYRYVEPFLVQNRSLEQERAYYLVASLFALHPVSINYGNLGAHLRACEPRDKPASDALERRFTALLASHPEDLPDTLRQAVSFLKSKEQQPVNWNQLFWDLQKWDSEDRRVQKGWANAFWGRERSAQVPTES